MLSGGQANQVVSWDSFPWNPLPPQAHLWFLWAMFVIGVAVHALRPVWRATARSVGVWWAAFAVTVLLSWQVPPLGDLAEWLVPAFLFAPCLIAGLLLQRMSFATPGIPGTLLLLAVFAGAVSVAVILPANRGVALAVAFVAPLALVQAMRGMAKAGLPMGGLALLGRASMAIFLAHTIFSAGLRIALVRMGLDDPALHIIAGTLIGIAGPLLLWHLARRTGTDRWLGF